MAVPKEYQADLQAVVSRRKDNGADFWCTSHGRWEKGVPSRAATRRYREIVKNLA